MTDYEIYKTGKVVNGEMQGISRKKLLDELKYFEGKHIELIIRRKRKHRSEQQNRLWWLYMSILSDELGYTKDEIHMIAKFKFLKREKVVEKTGEVMPFIASTSSLTTSEFMDLTAELTRWAAESFGITLPQPDQQLTIDNV